MSIKNHWREFMTSKGVPNPQNLKDYLGSRDLTEHLKLTKDISFHWANWDQTCLAQRRHYKNFNNNFHLMRMNTALNELKTKQIWLCLMTERNIYNKSRKLCRKACKLS